MNHHYSDYFYFILYVVFKSLGEPTKACLIHNVSNNTKKPTHHT